MTTPQRTNQPTNQPTNERTKTPVAPNPEDQETRCFTKRAIAAISEQMKSIPQAFRNGFGRHDFHENLIRGQDEEALHAVRLPQGNRLDDLDAGGFHAIEDRLDAAIGERDMIDRAISSPQHPLTDPAS